jgi:hypothetical protein
VIRRQADSALEQAELMNELLTRVVRLTEPLERAQRGGEYVAEGLKRAIFGAEQASQQALEAAKEADEQAKQAEERAEEAEEAAEDGGER